MSVVYWDTMLFVYWFEENEKFSNRLHTIFEGMEHRGDRLITSAFAVAELLVGPKRQKKFELSDQIEDAMRTWP
jgi:predicted nucleic acid-binding protein